MVLCTRLYTKLRACAQKELGPGFDLRAFTTASWDTATCRLTCWRGVMLSTLDRNIGDVSKSPEGPLRREGFRCRL